MNREDEILKLQQEFINTLFVNLHPHRVPVGEPLHLLVYQISRQLAESQYEIKELKTKTSRLERLTLGLERYG